MPNPTNTSTCLLCATRLVKNGTTSAGTQRWRCPRCGASSTRRRPDLTRRHELDRFLDWLTSKHAQSELPGTSARTFRRTTAWCWQIVPRLGPVETRHHHILLDGIYLGTWCLLIATTAGPQGLGHVLAWQWCATESHAAWSALLERIPAPTVAVCDGGTGLHSALRRHWPTTRVQRCIFHVQLGTRRHLTRNPRTDPGRRLLQLSRALSDIHDIDAAITWQQHLDTWWQAHGHLTKERTYHRHSGQWWYTHDRLRKAWHLLHRLNQQGVLFTYLEHGNARTTSALEGGINSGIRDLLRRHRGMPEAHLRRAAEWFLTLKELPRDQVYDLIPRVEPAPAPMEQPTRWSDRCPTTPPSPRTKGSGPARDGPDVANATRHTRRYTHFLAYKPEPASHQEK
ncbi:IS1249 family transposase [Gulosibacter macacae]|uniref:IS1249 family transposase n=1 Tax=Gulosibacter macacae TaxID=2488791 RepID=UPI001F206EBB|nr:IS1249 family transposase [Gulosibacter macacae]